MKIRKFQYILFTLLKNKLKNYPDCSTQQCYNLWTSLTLKTDSFLDLKIKMFLFVYSRFFTQCCHIY